jgi:hypothetical protein
MENFSNLSIDEQLKIVNTSLKSIACEEETLAKFCDLYENEVCQYLSSF